jgi:hypothetical protein
VDQLQLKNQYNSSVFPIQPLKPLERARRFALARLQTRMVEVDHPQTVSLCVSTALLLDLEAFEQSNKQNQAAPDLETNVKEELLDYIVITFIILISINIFSLSLCE